MTEKELWPRFCEAYGVDQNTEYEAWCFGGDDPDMLAELVRGGIKTATSSLYDLYEAEPGESLPREGDISIILNTEGDAVCLIRNTKVYVTPFCRVTAEQAYKEGEGDRSLTYWRKVHKDFFSAEAKKCGLSFHEEIRVVCEEFEVLFEG